MKSNVLESSIQKAVLQLLKMRGVVHYRMNSGVMRNPAGRPVRFGFVGCPDIWAIVPNSGGRLLTIEVKRPGGKPTESQAEVMAGLSAAGAAVLVIDDVGDLWVSIPGARLPDGRPQHDILVCCRDTEMEVSP